ncbi:MAG: CehA/McbA family metallohydrolase [Christensenellales bacterium]|jgi:hypothetical protein
MRITQPAFLGNGASLKGALHSHSTRSDGRDTPEEVLRKYRENGFDFVSLTDHRIYNFKNFAPDTNLTIIPGMEYDMNLSERDGFRCFHVVCIGDAEGNGFTQDQRFESAAVADQFAAQPYLDYIHANNNMTIYCHPEWSGTPARYFDQMRGNFAMEIWNSGCAMVNDMDTNAACWDELLFSGQKIFGVATDDGHSMAHHAKGWVTVNAENNVTAILSALRAGAFYSSCGPKFFDFSVEDGFVFVKCSPVKRLKLVSMCHPTYMQEGENITEAKIEIGNRLSQYRYLRIEIMDDAGRRAWTNPIFIDKDIRI